MTEILTILQILWPIIGGFIGGLGWYQFFHKKERRLFKNIRRPIAIIATADKPMLHEASLLKRVGFFDIEAPSSDRRAVDLLNGKRLAIIGYTPDSTDFRTAFTAAQTKEIPVIIYAGPTRITPEDMAMLQEYSHHSMCNTPLRLISDVFALMGTYPEDK